MTKKCRPELSDPIGGWGLSLWIVVPMITVSGLSWVALLFIFIRAFMDGHPPVY